MDSPENDEEPSLLYRAVVVGLFLTLMGVVMGVTSPDLADTDLGVVGNELHLPVIAASSLLYLFILARLFTRPQKMIRAAREILLFAPIVLFCILSATWSNDPSVTLRRALFLLLSTLVGLILGADFKIAGLVRLFATASLIHILLCAVYFVLSPHVLHSPSDPHSLKGLTTHKNIFGFEQGLALLAFLLVPFRRFTSLRVPLTIMAGGLLYLSHSSGALVSTAVAVASFPFLLIARFRGTQKIPLTIGALAIATAGVSILVKNATLLPALLSKDSTLTGRTQLWALVQVAINHHPLLGYGFDSFWQGLQGDSLTIIRGVGWLVPTAHNGYLDLLLGTGYLGALLFALPTIQTLFRALRYLTIERTSTKYFPIMFVIFWLISNLNESDLLTRTGIPLLFCVSFSAAIGLQIARARAEARNPLLDQRPSLPFAGTGEMIPGLPSF